MKHVPNKRILIVEDNAMVGEVIADVISEAGGWPIGPALSEREALDMIAFNPGTPDGAVLDLHLDGTTLSIAHRLRDLGVPFIFATGNRHDVPSEYRHLPVCEKPYTARELLASLEQAFATFDAEARPAE